MGKVQGVFLWFRLEQILLCQHNPYVQSGHILTGIKYVLSISRLEVQFSSFNVELWKPNIALLLMKTLITTSKVDGLILRQQMVEEKKSICWCINQNRCFIKLNWFTSKIGHTHQQNSLVLTSKTHMSNY